MEFLGRAFRIRGIPRNPLLRASHIKDISKKCCPYLDTAMSGSPIIQNGKFVGAVTHVLVNDPTQGYGILLEHMLEAAG